ncbi:fungal specific transcription factor domain-containing protein [Aspergillus mulundensis]|uniref:Xylanolytic transcriptional activator regulatory domain-containing protein n=1 Tax=Aspergillus mulundensis TaxID=1810919 RepID=A0A3D8QBX4_9EURO|nr:hypothetical protein DSM5745_11048 [Aspergillus mulundensis]RDW59353.1 hypothetical protein DSM5745_11048 [Aspergillus mulundensis]
MSDAIGRSPAQGALIKELGARPLECVASEGAFRKSTLQGQQGFISTVSTVAPSVQTPENSRNSSNAPDVTVLSPGIEDALSLESMPWLARGPESKSHAIADTLLTQDVSPSFTEYLTTGFVHGPSPLDLLDIADIADHETSILTNLAVGPPIGPHAPIATLRYPVLEPLMPFIMAKLSSELACRLLELFFTSAFPTQMQPVYHNIHCYVLRKAKFLTRAGYRTSSPALLASMLWAASSDDHALSLPIPAHDLKRISQFLGLTTMKLIRSSAYGSSDWRGHMASGTFCSTTGSGGFPEFTLYPASSDSIQGLECPTRSLDDVITYAHIASILSLNDQKAHSLKWWHTAFTLARELELNREIETILVLDSKAVCFPGDPPPSTRMPLNCVCARSYESTILITEEQREERRRAWWLLYIMDRHLSLCHNRPLMLLDSDSKDLLLPLDEEAWQAGKIHSNSPNLKGPHCVLSESRNVRRIFPDFTCHGPSLFGFFLPLMTIAGQMLDINQARTHPMLGSEILGEGAWETQHHEVLGQLDQYEASLHSFTTSRNGLKASSSAPPAQDTVPHSQAQTRSWLTQTIASYASFYIDVLHILQNGKWGPDSLTEAQDSLGLSSSLASSIPHALKAAESMRQILKFDSEFNLMPELFGAQLLQAGFYFLFILEHLQDQAGAPFLTACEVMIRATESCIVTLDNRCLRDFCQAMRSTLAQARGRPVTHHEIRQRRRAMVEGHRWARTDIGLAI